MAQKTLRTCFRVLFLAFLLTASAAQAAPAQAESPSGVVAAVFDWLRAQLAGWIGNEPCGARVTGGASDSTTAKEPKDEIYGGYPPNGAPDSTADEPTDDELHGIYIPGG